MDTGRGLAGNKEARRVIAQMVKKVDIDDRYLKGFYRFRKRFWSLWGNRVDVKDEWRGTVLCAYQKAMRLREDLRIYGDTGHTQELMHIQARQIMNFSASYDVIDSPAATLVGTIRRKGWSSLARDAWEILSPDQQLIATISEDSMGLALLRRFALGSLLPATFHFRNMDGVELATVRTQFNVFYTVMDLSIHSTGGPRLIDPRLLLAGTALLTLVEGKQSSHA